MPPKLLELRKRPTGHLVTVWRNSAGAAVQVIIPATTDPQTAIPRIHRRLVAEQTGAAADVRHV